MFVKVRNTIIIDIKYWHLLDKIDLLKKSQIKQLNTFRYFFKKIDW